LHYAVQSAVRVLFARRLQLLALYIFARVAAAGLVVHQIKPIIVLPQGVASDDRSRPAGRWRYPIVVRLSLATVCASRPVTGDRQCEPACRWRWLLRAWVRLAVGSANHAATSRVDAHCGHR